MEPAVFLDRDNTLIANDGDLGDPDRVHLLRGVPDGLKALREAGYRLIVVTNQAGVARGVFSESDVDRVHERIAETIDAETGARHVIDRFYYCPYHPEGRVEAYRRDHPWRKPRAGMLLQAAHDLGLDLTRSWMIGDQPRDILAGQSAGCRTVLIGDGDGGDARPTASAKSFDEAVQLVLQRTSRGTSSGGANDHGEGHARGAAATLTTAVTEIKKASPGERRPAPAVPARAGETAGDEPASLRRAITELTDEIRSRRQRRAEFTGLKMAAVIVQLLAATAAVLALLQVGESGTFMAWMLGAVMLQLVTVTLIIADLRS